MILKLCTVVRCISDLLIIRFDLHHFTLYHNAHLHNRMHTGASLPLACSLLHVYR